MTIWATEQPGFVGYDPWQKGATTEKGEKTIF